MKKFIILISVLLSITSVIAQTPQAFKYQAVARDINGDVLVNKSIALKVSILKDGTSGMAVYTETHNPSTNDFGLINLEIGNGALVTGNFMNIEWGNDTYFIKIEMDATGGTNYQLMGTSQLLSVPYALYAKKTGNVNDADADSTNEIQILSINKDTLHITHGNFVNLDVDRIDRDTTNELQTLSIVGNQLQISKGNSVTFTGAVDLDPDPTNELQNLSLINDSLILSNGGSVKIRNGIGSVRKSHLSEFDNNFSGIYKISPDQLCLGSFIGDNYGNMYILSAFKGTIKIGTTTHTGLQGVDNIFIAKIDSLGVIQWLRIVGGLELDDFDMVMDNNENFYIAGAFQGTAIFGTIVTTAVGKEDIFIVKYNKNRGVLWAKTAGSSDYDRANALSIDSLSNVYITGYIGNIAYFGSKVIFNNGNHNFFISKYDSQGVNKWVKYSNGIGWETGNHIALGNNGKLYIIGDITNSLIFGNDTIKCNTPSAFLSIFDSSGSHISTKTIEKLSNTFFRGIEVDSWGNINFIGKFENGITLDSINMSCLGDNCAFIGQYDKFGKIKWANSLGGDLSEHWGGDVCMVSKNNEIYLAGLYKSYIIINDSIYYGINLNLDHLFISEYSNSGNYIRFRDLDFIGTAYCPSLCKSKDSLYLFVNINGIFFNNGIRYSSGSYIFKL